MRAPYLTAMVGYLGYTFAGLSLGKPLGPKNNTSYIDADRLLDPNFNPDSIDRFGIQLDPTTKNFLRGDDGKRFLEHARTFRQRHGAYLTEVGFSEGSVSSKAMISTGYVRLDEGSRDAAIILHEMSHLSPKGRLSGFLENCHDLLRVKTAGSLTLRDTLDLIAWAAMLGGTITQRVTGKTTGLWGWTPLMMSGLLCLTTSPVLYEEARASSLAMDHLWEQGTMDEYLLGGFKLSACFLTYFFGIFTTCCVGLRILRPPIRVSNSPF